VRVGLVSAKGSPGVTTLGLAMSAATGGVLVELDPAGGDVGCWAGPRGEPGLIRLVALLRHSPPGAALLEAHAPEVWPGVQVVWAPPEADRCEGTVAAIGGRLAPMLRMVDGWVVLDGGRWSPSQATAQRLEGCDVVGLVVSPTISGVAHARSLVASLRDFVGSVPVLAIVVGDRGYRTGDVADALGVRTLGPVPWDPRWTQVLLTAGASRLWRRSAFARSVRAVVEDLAGLDVLEAVAGG
jgi:hypothetical protein